MASIWRIRRAVIAIATGVAIAISALLVPIAVGALSSAQAQISADAQIALEPYGVWRPHPRLGNVWVPAGGPPDWRPYEYGIGSTPMSGAGTGSPTMSRPTGAGSPITTAAGHSSAASAGSGCRAMNGHRPGSNWRYGDDYVGWAPLPPDDVESSYEVEPAYWAFVPGRYLTRAAAAHLLRAGASALGHPAHNKYRQSHRSRAWRATGGQSGNSASLHRRA